MRVDIHTLTHPPVYDLTAICMGCAALQWWGQWHMYICDDPDGDFDLDRAFERLDEWRIPHDKSRYAVMYPANDRITIWDKRNFLLRYSTDANLIAIMDADDYYAPGYLATVLPPILRDPRINGQFYAERATYDIARLAYQSRYVGGGGSGHWVFKRAWQKYWDLWFEPLIENGRIQPRGSDCMFRRRAKERDPDFRWVHARQYEHPGDAIRIRHGQNTCRFNPPMSQLRPDPHLKMLSQLVEPRLFRAYQEVISARRKRSKPAVGGDVPVAPA